MNYTTIQVPLADAAKKLNCDELYVDWWSWPQVFGSTAGPRQGIGGQMMTTFQVFGFEGLDGKRFLSCAGVWREWKNFPEQRWGR